MLVPPLEEDATVNNNAAIEPPLQVSESSSRCSCHGDVQSKIEIVVSNCDAHNASREAFEKAQLEINEEIRRELKTMDVAWRIGRKHEKVLLFLPYLGYGSLFCCVEIMD